MVANNLIRRLGNAEYFYYQYNKIAPTNFAVVIELIRQINPSDLRKAINIVVNNYQSFCTTINSTNDTDLYFKRSDKIKYYVNNLSGNTNYLIELVEQKTNTALVPENLPIDTTYFLNTETNSFHIIFTINHLLTDAIGGISICKEILKNVYQEEFDKLKAFRELHPNLEQFFPRSAKGWTFINGLTKYLYHYWKYYRKWEKFKYYELKKHSFRHRKLTTKYIILQNNNFTQLLNQSRKLDLTVNQILSAIQILAFRNEIQKEGDIPLVLSVPINLRNKLTRKIESDIPGLFIAIPKLTIFATQDDNLYSIAIKIKQELRNQIKTGQIFINWKILPRSRFSTENNGGGNIEKMFSKNIPSSIITNVGYIKGSDNIDKYIKSIYLAVAPPKDALLCSALCSYKKTLTINYSFNSSLMSIDLIERMYRNINHQIFQFIKG